MTYGSPKRRLGIASRKEFLATGRSMVFRCALEEVYDQLPSTVDRYVRLEKFTKHTVDEVNFSLKAMVAEKGSDKLFSGAICPGKVHRMNKSTSSVGPRIARLPKRVCSSSSSRLAWSSLKS